MKKVVLFCLLSPFISFLISSKPLPDAVAVKLTPEELKLYNMISAYRVQNGLKPVPLSVSLTEVAHQHVQDLEDNYTEGGGCNLHSWSGKGKWTSCCYTPDHAQKYCMWNKPSELTAYKGKGFEIAAQQSEPIDASIALPLWKASPFHNDVLLNKGIYKANWNAMGVGIYKKYAVVWFGHETDSLGAPAK